jgi:fatty acid CoA ligase FadD9
LASALTHHEHHRLAVDDLSVVADFAIATPTVRSIIAFDYDERDDEKRVKYETAGAKLAPHQPRLRINSLQELIVFGRGHPWQPLPPNPKGVERITSIIHSSGSTGTPKGALIPDRMSTVVWTGTDLQQIPSVGIVFAPMNHFIGRYHVFQTLSMGGTAHFTLKPDLSTLFEDIRAVRPTFISFFPRIFDLIYQCYQSEVVATQVRAEMRNTFLGDRPRGGTIGSAPCSPEVKEFIRDCFDIMLLEGYGTTEGGIQITAGDGGVVRRGRLCLHRRHHGRTRT